VRRARNERAARTETSEVEPLARFSHLAVLGAGEPPAVPVKSLSDQAEVSTKGCSHLGLKGNDYGPNLCLYSVEMMKALTISALTKLPLNWFSLSSQNCQPEKSASGGSFGFLLM